MFGKMSKCCQNVWSTHTKDTAMEINYRTVEKNQICRSYWRWVEDQNGILLEAWRSRCNRLNWDMKECYFQDNFAIFRHSTYPLPNMDKCFRAISKNQIKNGAPSITKQVKTRWFHAFSTGARPISQFEDLDQRFLTGVLLTFTQRYRELSTFSNIAFKYILKISINF